VIDYLIAKATPQKGGVFLWQTDWDAIVRKLQSLEKENNSLRRMLHDSDTVRANEIWRGAV
jgi:hypothetical protein